MSEWKKPGEDEARLDGLMQDYEVGNFHQMMADLDLDLDKIVQEAKYRVAQVFKVILDKPEEIMQEENLLTMWIAAFVQGVYFQMERASSSQGAG